MSVSCFQTPSLPGHVVWWYRVGASSISGARFPRAHEPPSLTRLHTFIVRVSISYFLCGHPHACPSRPPKTRTVEEAAPGPCLQGAGKLDLVEGVDLAQLELFSSIELCEALPVRAHVRHASALVVGRGRADGSMCRCAGRTRMGGMTSCGVGGRVVVVVGSEFVYACGSYQRQGQLCKLVSSVECQEEETWAWARGAWVGWGG